MPGANVRILKIKLHDTKVKSQFSYCRYWRCNIVGAPCGKLLEETIAMKDTISVAGIPMMCRSHLLEGYIPDYDATVVSRILDAGGTITDKAVCEEWCFTATSCTSFTGPVINPHDEKRMALGSSSGCAALVSVILSIYLLAHLFCARIV